MNSVLNTALLSVATVLITLFSVAEAGNSQAEGLFIEYKYAGHGKMEFPDDEKLFCEFMRPRRYEYLGFNRKENERVLLEGRLEEMYADLVTCSYANSDYSSAPTYSRGPQGQYYEMDDNNNHGHWTIGDLAPIYDASGERALHDYFQSIPKNEVPFTYSERSFCKNRIPVFADDVEYAGSKSVSVKLFRYAVGRTVRVELCRCDYSYGSKTQTVYYAEFPEKYIYEIRELDFKHDQNDAWVVWGHVETL